jgi:hypothetical protein
MGRRQHAACGYDLRATPGRCPGVRYNRLVKRLLRILLNAATALSLLLCGVAVGLWVRSHYCQENLNWYGNWGSVGAMNSRGDVECYVAGYAGEARPTQFRYTRFDRPQGLAARVAFLVQLPEYRHVGPCLGAVLLWARGSDGRLHVEVAAPWWLITCLLALVPAFRLARRTLRRRPGTGAPSCPACGYDLRATPDRCPECGKTVAP